MWHNCNKLLFTRVDNSSLILFRIIFGALLSIEAFGSLALGAVKKLYLDPQYTFPFIDFEFLKPLPPTAMYGLFTAMGIAGVLIMIGAKYRLAMVFYAVSFTYVYLLQKTSYNNHSYLIMLLNYIMIFLPANATVSVDSKLNPRLYKNYVHRWVYLFIISFISIVYIYASVAKFYTDWIDGTFIKHLMQTRGRDFAFLQQDWVHTQIIYFGLFFDMLIVPFLLWKRSRWLAVAASVFFHLFNSIVFQIGIFPYLALGFLVFFFTQKTLQRRLLPFKIYYSKNDVVAPKNKNLILFCASTFLIVMLLLPLRHWIIKDDVLWTEEGHRLSWRMMLRSRGGSAVYTIVDKKTGKTETVNLTDYLSPSQLGAVQDKPDFMWQFAQYLKKQKAAKGQDIAVYVDAYVKINGKPLKKFTDETVDLASEPWYRFKHHEWILPSPSYKSSKPGVKKD